MRVIRIATLLLALCASTQAAAQLAAGPAIFVREIRLDGNTLIRADIASAMLAPYSDRAMTADELHEVARRLTAYVVEQGYVSSGVVLPDQRVEDGIVRLQLIEGRIGTTIVTGERRLRDSFILARLGDVADEPLNVKALATRLQLLQQHPRIARIDASISPGLERGAAILALDVEERPVFGLSVSANNHISPNVGEQQILATAFHDDLFGFGDSVRVAYSHAEGFDGLVGSLTIPISTRDTQVQAYGEYSHSEIVTAPFNVLGIEGESARYGVELHHPLVRTLSTHVAISLGIERQEVRSYLLGEPFSFSVADENGLSRATMIVASQEWAYRQASRVVAIRSTFHAGIDALGASIGGQSDSEFLSWLGQAHWLEKLQFLDSTLALRLQGRLSNDSLPGYRKYALGGNASVRGYRENLFVRDHGGLVSLEWSVPVARWAVPGLSKTADDGVLRIAPFVDYGAGRDKADDVSQAIDLASVGILVEWNIAANSKIELQLAKALIERPAIATERTLQDEGVHFGVSIGWSP